MATRTHSRFDFRAGVVTSHSEDILDRRELVWGKNSRLSKYGAIQKRAGSQRLHDTALESGATVLGIYQWDAPSVDGEIVAISNGDLHHFDPASDTEFTNVTGSLSTTRKPWFTPHIDAGTPTLYIADGTLRKWTGTALSNVTGAPAGAIAAAVYKTRLFVVDGSKTLYWSVVAEPENWTVGDGAGQDPVETYDSDGLIGLAKDGSSLLLFKENSIARFTGVSASNIRIDEETEGVSAEVGCIAPQTIVEFERGVFFLSDRGPYIATETAAGPVGIQVEDQFDAISGSNLSAAVACHNRHRREIWLLFPSDGLGWCWNYRLGSWTGPWDLPYNVTAAGRYELTSGAESVILGGDDGFVRDGDVETYGAKDDVVRAGTGGTNVTLSLEWPDLTFSDPALTKILTPEQYVLADLKDEGEMTVSFQGDRKSAQEKLIRSSGDGRRRYHVRPGTTGKEITLSIEEATSEIVTIHGLRLEAQMGRRAA